MERLKRMLCWMTFQHRGHVDHDDIGVFWECDGLCGHRVYVPWSETPIGRV